MELSEILNIILVGVVVEIPLFFLCPIIHNYKLEIINDMEDNKEKLIVEQQELKEKLSKLTEFMNSEEYYKLSSNNRLVLKNQKIAMELYLQVLNMRVFENVDNVYVPDYSFM